MSSDYWDDLDSEETIAAITAALQSGGHQVTFVEGNIGLYEGLQQLQPEICFNITEGHFGDSREPQVPAMLEMLQLPHRCKEKATGSGLKPFVVVVFSRKADAIYLRICQYCG